MANKIKDFVDEQRQMLAEQAGRLRTEPVRAAREATVRSADRIKALKAPIRAVSRSGVKLTVISQGTVERLINLQEQLVTNALNDAASQLERAARAENVRDLVRDQADVLRATRERVVSDFGQAVAILKDAGIDVRKVATHTYASVRGQAEEAAPRKAKTARRKTARKSPARKK